MTLEQQMLQIDENAKMFFAQFSLSKLDIIIVLHYHIS